MEKNYYILVSEPWDFSGQDGENIINGNIVKIVSDRCLVFHLNNQVEIGGDKIDTLVLIPRFLEDNFYEIEEKTIITVNGCSIKYYKEEMNESDLIKLSKFKIIGSLREVK